MNKLILAVAMIVLISNLAQSQPDKRDDFMGIWQWHNATDTFIIKFKKGIGKSRFGNIKYHLYGYCSYKQGNKTIFNTLGKYDTGNRILAPIFCSYLKEEDAFYSVIYDSMYMSTKDLTLTLSADKKTMYFEATNPGEFPIFIIREGDPMPRDVNMRLFSFPQKMTFTKVEDIPVVVLPPPTLSTGGFTNLGFYSATLHGAIHPKSNPDTKVFFEYGTSTDYGKSITATPATESGNMPVNISANLSGLTANNTSYHYRLMATTNASVYYGEDKTFTTPYDAPSMINLREIEILSQSATLTGIVNAHNLGQCNVSIEYSNVRSPGKIQKADPQPFIIDGDRNTNFVAELKGLLPGYQHRCRVVCTIGTKTYYGAYFYFTAVYKTGPLEGDKIKE